MVSSGFLEQQLGAVASPGTASHPGRGGAVGQRVKRPSTATEVIEIEDDEEGPQAKRRVLSHDIAGPSHPTAAARGPSTTAAAAAGPSNAAAAAAAAGGGLAAAQQPWTHLIQGVAEAARARVLQWSNLEPSRAVMVAAEAVQDAEKSSKVVILEALILEQLEPQLDAQLQDAAQTITDIAYLKHEQAAGA